MLIESVAPPGPLVSVGQPPSTPTDAKSQKGEHRCTRAVYREAHELAARLGSG